MQVSEVSKFVKGGWVNDITPDQQLPHHLRGVGEKWRAGSALTTDKHQGIYMPTSYSTVRGESAGTVSQKQLEP